MPHYPFTFVQGDALEYAALHWMEYDLIHASPPCQGYSQTKTMPWVNTDQYPKLVEPVRQLLKDTGKPYVIENVPGSPLVEPIMLCGLMFNMRIFRHRLFEVHPFILSVPHVDHPKGAVTNSFRKYSSFATGASHISMTGHNFSKRDAVIAMNGDCDWMTREEIAECVPPVYTEFIARQLVTRLPGPN